MGSGGEPRNRAVADVVPAGDLAHRLAVAVAAADRLPLRCSVNFGLRSSLTPRALARARPSVVRAWINSFSNSASPPNTVSISRPCGVVVSAVSLPRTVLMSGVGHMVVSAHASLWDREPASFSRLPQARPRDRDGSSQSVNVRDHRDAAGELSHQPATPWPIYSRCLVSNTKIAIMFWFHISLWEPPVADAG